MGLRKKKSLMDQAGDYVATAKPHVEAALESARDFVQDTALPALNDAKDKAGPALADARDKAAPVIADARDKAAANLSDARDKAAPVIASGAAIAAERATAAKSKADAKVAELKGEPPKKKGGKLKKLVLLAGLAGAVAFVAKKLQGGSSSDNWQSSYTPSPPPSPRPTTTPTPAAPGAGADPLTDDIGGASPDEALADAADAPHPVTTPDEPAEVVELDQDDSDGQPKP